ncbi:MAG: hypothetical protein JM58_11185 [Peptococcaceae bacterium BICA1-8]|nr:MAG: hypothetical protein JM58_11185 [Peptococcaceae bacterium BICA1-8]
MTFDTNVIWEKYSAGLFKYILKHVNNQYDAEDLLQEVFLKIHKNIKNGRNENIQAWVYKIARNTVIDYYRKNGKFNFSEFTDDISSVNEDRGVTDEIIECLLSMTNDLPDKYKQALLLTQLGGMTQKEMAEEKNLSSSGAKSRVQRARQKLKTMFTDCCTYKFDRLGNIVDYEQKKKDCKYC